MKVTVISINPPNAMRSRKAVATVKIAIDCNPDWSLTIDDITIMRDAGEIWFGLPRANTTGTWFPAVVPSTKLRLAIAEAVLPAVESWLVGQSTSAQASEVGRG